MTAIKLQYLLKMHFKIMFYASKYKHHKVYCLSHFSVYNSAALITFTSYNHQLCMFLKNKSHQTETL